jgi:hypothetical protein
VTWRIVLNEDPLRDERVMEPICNDCWLDRLCDAASREEV